MALTEMKIKQIAAELQDALQVIARKHDVSIAKGAISFSSTSFSCKLTGSCETAPALNSKIDSAELVGRKFKSGGNNVYSIIELIDSNTVRLRTQRGTLYTAWIATLANVVWVK